MSDLSDAHLVADEALRLKEENERLRALILAIVVTHGLRSAPGLNPCPICGSAAMRHRDGQWDDHAVDGLRPSPMCSWPALWAEAKK